MGENTFYIDEDPRPFAIGPIMSIEKNEENFDMTRYFGHCEGNIEVELTRESYWLFHDYLSTLPRPMMKRNIKNRENFRKRYLSKEKDE